VVDPVVRHLGASLLPAFEHPGTVSRLYVEHVALALCSHLASTYGGFSGYERAPKGGLTPRQAERAKAYMADHCDEDLSLADVAHACNLSRGYFTQAFKVTTGLTPHQWRLHHRIDKAKSLLLETSTPVAEIAFACGFADQSHLTRVFVQQVGDSPASWRRQRRA
jgi:AraC family transcriptional regulator